MSTERPKIDFYFSFISLWSYIGSNVFRDLVRDLECRGVLQADGLCWRPSRPAAASRCGSAPTFRQSYRLVEMERWKAVRNIPLVTMAEILSGQSDGRTSHAARGGRERPGCRRFRASQPARPCWADELNIEDPDTLVALADKSGLDGKALLARVDEPGLVAAERKMTEEAVERQVFGAPFYFYRDEPFWGQDRLDMLRDAITSGRPPIAAPHVAGLGMKLG